MKLEGIPKLSDDTEQCHWCTEWYNPILDNCPYCGIPNLTKKEHPWAYKLPNDEPVKDLFDDDKEN